MSWCCFTSIICLPAWLSVCFCCIYACTCGVYVFITIFVCYLHLLVSNTPHPMQIGFQSGSENNYIISHFYKWQIENKKMKEHRQPKQLVLFNYIIIIIMHKNELKAKTKPNAIYEHDHWFTNELKIMITFSISSQIIALLKYSMCVHSIPWNKSILRDLAVNQSAI